MLTAVQPPRTPISVAACTPGPLAGRWRVAWLIANDANEPIWLDDAWVPHGRFRGDGHVPLSLTVEPGGSVRLELSVASAEPAGTVVENAFLILRMGSGGQ